MSNNNPFTTELDWEEVLEVARIMGILRTLSKKRLQPEDLRTPEEKWLDQLEEYNPFFSRERWTGEVKDKLSKEEYDSLLAQFPLSS